METAQTDREIEDVWPLRAWDPIDVTVGLFAWWGSALIHEGEAVQDRPSLVVVEPDLDTPRLAQLGQTLSKVRGHRDAAAGHAPRWPVMVGLRQPPFARWLPKNVRDRIETLGLGGGRGGSGVDVLALWVEQPQDLKAGAMLQTMFDLRHEGLTRHIGLVCEDPRGAEWLAMNTAARVVGFTYHLADQAAGYRAISAAADHGMACLAIGVDDRDDQAVRFAMGQSAHALPVLGTAPRAGLRPMTHEETRESWQGYRATHDAPPPLPRGRPPEVR